MAQDMWNLKQRPYASIFTGLHACINNSDTDFSTSILQTFKVKGSKIKVTAWTYRNKKLRYRIDFKLCLIVHKALVGHAPQYIADLIRPVADLPSRASLRTALSGDLYVPLTRRRFGDRAFAVAAPCVWNSLFTDIKLHRSTTTSFKRRLKTVYETGASLNICKWLCNALPVF